MLKTLVVYMLYLMAQTYVQTEGIQTNKGNPQIK